jgi:hypothetical protein
VSLTLRTSLLVREFRRLSGSAIVAYPGEVLAAGELAMISDRKQLLARLYDAVFELEMPQRSRRKASKSPSSARLPHLNYDRRPR